MIIKWNTKDIINQINTMSWTITDPREDGFTTWGIKQDLYRIKWAVDAALEKSSTYSVEEEWLKEHEKEVVWQKLKSKHL